MALLVVGLGGAFGAMARYLATDWVRGMAGDGFPWGTLAVNVTGSFALGFALVWLQSQAPSEQFRHFVAIGFLGSFTTFSTFSYETVALARSSDFAKAGAYALGSVGVGIGAVLLGAALAGLIVAADR